MTVRFRKKAAVNDRHRELYSRARAATLAFGDRANCAVVTLAAIAGVTYSEAREVALRHGYVQGKGMSTAGLYNALAAFGWTVEHVWTLVEKNDVIHGKQPGSCQRYNVRQTENRLPAEGRYLILTDGHALAYVDGEVVDRAYRCRTRVHGVLRCEKAGAA